MSKYKDRLKSQVKKASQENTAFLQTFFDDTKSVEDRLRAFEQVGTFSNEDDVNKAIALFRDADQNTALRAAALEGLIYHIGDEESLMDEIIALVDNQEAAVELRTAAISVMQANSFSSPIYPSKQPAYHNALKSVIDDQDDNLKSAAMEYLALVGDEYVQRRLLEGLEDAKQQLTQPEVAIQLLSYDLHADHFPVLRKIAKEPPNPESKKEALRNLAADTESKDLLTEVMKDAKEDPELRHLCAVALQQQTPDEVNAYAKEVILNAEEDESLKAAMLNTLKHSAAPAVLREDQEFNEQLKKAQGEYKSNELKKMYNQYQDCINKEDID